MLVLLVLVLVLLVLLVRELLPSTAWLADVPHIELCVTARCVFHSLPPSPLGARAGGHRVFPFISADLVVVLSCLTTTYPLPTVALRCSHCLLHHDCTTKDILLTPYSSQLVGQAIFNRREFHSPRPKTRTFCSLHLSLRLATKTAYAETRLPPTRSDRQLGSLSLSHSLPPAPTNPFSRVELECAEPVSPVLVGSEPGQLSTFCSSHRQPEALLQAFVSRHRLPYCCAGTLSHRSRLPFPALPCPALPSPSSSPYITYLHARTRSRRLDSLSTVQCIGLGWRKTRAIPTEFHRRQQREWGVSSPPLHPSSPARRISSHCTATDPIVWYLSDLH